MGDVPAELSIWRALDTYHGRLPAWLLPIAEDEYGNLFAVSPREQDRGSVWFWDHEEEADEDEPPSQDNIELRAPNWHTFLDGIRPQAGTGAGYA